MNELQFPGLYIDDTANPHTILSFLCQSGYYCLILTDFLAEFGTKCGRVHCDYCDGTLISYRPDTVCVEIPAPCLWMVAFHPDLFKGKMLEKTIEEIRESLHNLNKEDAEKISDVIELAQQELVKSKPKVSRLRNCLTMFAPMFTIANGIPTLTDNLHKLQEIIMSYIK